MRDHLETFMSECDCLEYFLWMDVTGCDLMWVDAGRCHLVWVGGQNDKALQQLPSQMWDNIIYRTDLLV